MRFRDATLVALWLATLILSFWHGSPFLVFMSVVGLLGSLSYVVSEAEPNSLEENALRYLAVYRCVGTSKMAKKLGITERHARRILKKLASEGKVERTESGWEITERGVKEAPLSMVDRLTIRLKSMKQRADI